MTTRAIGMVCFGSVGGSGTVAVELAHELAKRGHRMCLIARGRPARLASEIEFVDVPTVQHALFESSPYTLSLAGVLSRVSAERSLDVIHLHYAVPHAASAILLAHTLGGACPALITTVHGTDVTTFGQHHALGAITGACLRSMDAVTTPSHYLRAKAAEAYGIDAVVVPNFVEPSVFTPRAAHSAPGGAAQAALTLVHVSSFRPVKATAELVPMMRALCRSIEGGVRLVLIGEGPERARVMREADEACVAACMTFVPTIETPSELARWVAAADLFVLPSESESFGLAALEALACGVPVVARRVGGVPEVVSDGETGVLVDEAGDLAEAIFALAADRDRLTQMSSRAAADARRRFSPEVVTAAYEAVYQRAADVRAQRGA